MIQTGAVEKLVQNKDDQYVPNTVMLGPVRGCKEEAWREAQVEGAMGRKNVTFVHDSCGLGHIPREWYVAARRGQI